MRARGKIKTVAIVAGVALAAAVVWQLPVTHWIVALAERLRGMGMAGVALFIVIYAVAVVAMLPGSLLTLTAGFVYGPVGGLLVASPASVLGATLAFMLARSALRGWILARIDGYPKARALDTALGANSFVLILLLRFSPAVPFNVLNYALGLSDVTLGRYVAASFIGMLPGTWFIVYLGSLATTAGELTQAGRNSSPQQWVLTGAGLVATIVAIALVTRAARRALDEQLATKAH